MNLDTSRHRPARHLPLVSDVMRVDVVTVVPEMTARELIHVLLENSISGAPVVDSRGRIVGVVSVTDVLRLEGCIPADGVGAAQEEGEACALDRCRVRDLLAPITHTVAPSAPLTEALRLMRTARTHRVLVMQDGILHGIITPFDALEVLVEG